MKPFRKTLTAQLKVADAKNDVPSISENNARFLAHLIQKRQCKTGLEIGTAHAYSTIHLGDAFEANHGYLQTIEHSPPSFNQAKLNIYRAKLETTVTQHLGRAQNLLAFELDSMAPFDFIFIDGIKKSTLEFFKLCAPLLAPNGVMVVDDVIKYKAKMQPFYDFLEQQNHWHYEIKKLDEDDGIMLIEARI